MEQHRRIFIAVSVMVLKGGCILWGKRKGGSFDGYYAFPGGHLEEGETFKECARRETQEECGIEIKNVRFQCVVNFVSRRHYVHVQMVADWKNGEPRRLEPDEHEEWIWRPLAEIPRPTFPPCEVALLGLTTKRRYYELRQ